MSCFPALLPHVGCGGFEGASTLPILGAANSGGEDMTGIVGCMGMEGCDAMEGAMEGAIVGVMEEAMGGEDMAGAGGNDTL